MRPIVVLMGCRSRFELTRKAFCSVQTDDTKSPMPTKYGKEGGRMKGGKRKDISTGPTQKLAKDTDVE